MTNPNIVCVSPGVWRAVCDDWLIEASGVVRDKDVVRCVLKVSRPDGTLVTIDRVNLTSGKARGRFLDPLKAKHGIVISEDVLMALGNAVRSVQAPGIAPIKDDTPPDFSGRERLAFDAIEQKLRSHLLLEDPDAFRVMVACMAAHRMGGDPVWLLLVGPSSGAKTELLMLLCRTPKVINLSDLTEKTFASGLQEDGKAEPSLLSRLRDETLVLKDFTTVLSMSLDKRKEILAQLREIYDGRYDKVWGTGKELHWQGRIGLLAGVTPVIDRQFSVMSALGQRFVLLRVRQANRNAVARRAMRNTEGEHRGTRTELALDVAAFITRLSIEQPEVSDEHQSTLAGLADLVTRARSAVERDGYKRDIDYTPEPEMPARFARQLLSLARGLALVGERLHTNDADIATVIRVGLDSVPDLRRTAMEHLVAGQLTIDKLAAKIPGFSLTTVNRTLEDLETLALVQCMHRHSTTGGQLWSLPEEIRILLADLLEKKGERSISSHPQESEGKGVSA